MQKPRIRDYVKSMFFKVELNNQLLFFHKKVIMGLQPNWTLVHQGAPTSLRIQASKCPGLYFSHHGPRSACAFKLPTLSPLTFCREAPPPSINKHTHTHRAHGRIRHLLNSREMPETWTNAPPWQVPLEYHPGSGAGKTSPSGTKSIR